jgi:leucyl aminopeptidase
LATSDLLTLVSIGLIQLLAVISPGPSFLITARTAVAHSRLDGFKVALGLGAGTVIWSSAALLGLNAVFHAVPMLFMGMKIAGALFLLYIAYIALRATMDDEAKAARAGAILALALRNSPAPALAVLPIAENATGAASYRPGDILRSFSGKTIEVVDTDAEGRLILADALAWTARQHKPRAMIDLATLTGSIVVALGHHHAGMFDNNAALADKVAAAGRALR